MIVWERAITCDRMDHRIRAERGGQPALLWRRSADPAKGAEDPDEEQNSARDNKKPEHEIHDRYDLDARLASFERAPDIGSACHEDAGFAEFPKCNRGTNFP